MSLAQVLSSYLNLNILILIGFFSLGIFSWLVRRSYFDLSAVTELKLHYSVLALILLLTVIYPVLPSNEVFSPAAKVWSAQSIQSFIQDDSMLSNSGYLSVPTPMGTANLSLDQVSITWSVLSVILLILGALYIGRDLRILFVIRKKSFLVRRLGRVCICVSDTIHVPFSFWFPGQANIVMPSSLIENRGDYKIAMAHELQHHRQGDTRWVYVLWAIRLICLINPAIHLWNRWISEIQEFACDETLVDQKKVESQDYARCLVEVAQTAINQKHVPVCATGLTFMIERNLLKRRIEKMLSKKLIRMDWKISVSVGLLITSIMGATAFASKGLIQDRRVNRAQALAMAERAQIGTQFPLIVNDRVVKQLNRYIGTPEGREFMRSALARMESYKATVSEHLQKYGVPAEIMALPIVESGYQNLVQGQGSESMKAAGLWQFIPSTARIYGLTVDSQKDERLHVGLSTDAAMRYLKSNNLRFNDWHLSALAYNMGENAVQKGIDALGSRDAWTLIQNGYEGDKDYLPKLMAAILILRNPDSLQ